MKFTKYNTKFTKYKKHQCLIRKFIQQPPDDDIFVSPTDSRANVSDESEIKDSGDVIQPLKNQVPKVEKLVRAGLCSIQINFYK